MKKYLALIIVIVVLIVIAFFVYFNNSSQQGSPVEQVKTEGSNAFSSIKDAMSKSLSLKCEYDMGEGKTTTYIKGNMIRGITEVKKEESKFANFIVKDNKMWMWNEGEKDGYIFEFDEEELSNDQENVSGETSISETIEELEEYKDKCVASVVSDSMFAPPVSVNFKNLSNLQEEMMQGLEDITGLPEVPVDEE